MNRVQLIGNLGVDPTLRTTTTGKSVANFTVATNRYFVDDQGRDQQRVEWHRIVVWGKSAEACAEFLKKGRRVFLEGSLRTRQWADKEGIKRYTTEVYTNYVDFLGGNQQDAKKNQGASNEDGGPQDSPDSVGGPDLDLDPPF